jgi:predicted AAA+ superfamily ATPase
MSDDKLRPTVDAKAAAELIEANNALCLLVESMADVNQHFRSGMFHRHQLKLARTYARQVDQFLKNLQWQLDKKKSEEQILKLVKD